MSTRWIFSSWATRARDIKALSARVGIRIAAVTWGYNSRHSLVAMKPDFVFDDLRNLSPCLPVKPPRTGSDRDANGNSGEWHGETCVRSCNGKRYSTPAGLAHDAEESTPSFQLHRVRGGRPNSRLRPDWVYLPNIARVIHRIARSLENLPTRAVLRMRHPGPVRFVAEGSIDFFWHSL